MQEHSEHPGRSEGFRNPKSGQVQRLNIDNTKSHVPDVSDVYTLISDDYWFIDYMHFNKLQ